METPQVSSDSSNRVPLGGDYWEAAPAAPLWGFADLHAHLMSHLAFGGQAFWGLPFDPDHSGDGRIEHALASCAPIHGGLINANPEFGHPAGGGWPDFIIWPHFTSLVHQQAYIDWLYRAYQGGLRLITCLAVNNELLAIKSSPTRPHDDKSAIEIQIAGMKEMARFVDIEAGGPGKGWLQIAYSPEEARRTIGENRLAVILGVEVDSLGNWRRPEDLAELSHGDLGRAREIIGTELDWLYGLGVRQITPIHLINNAFGGTAIYLRFLEMVNIYITGEPWTVEDAWETGVRYRIDHDGADLFDDFERTVAVAGRHLRAMHRRTLVDHIPGIKDLFEATEAPKIKGGHANARGLNEYGRIVLEEMMARGIIIDLDHMSEKATDAALALAEEHSYPVICSHCWFRDLLFSGHAEFNPNQQELYDTSDVHKVAHEAGKRGDQIERIGRLGGMVAPILNQGDIAGPTAAFPEFGSKDLQTCAGSSSSWARAYLYAVAKSGGRGVAMGSDINGAAGLPGPRFGTFAAYGARHDKRRSVQRREEIDRQANGVAYDQPIRDYRWFRFESSGPGAYEERDREIWEAIAQHAAGFNPSLHRHPAHDFPEGSLRMALESVFVHREQERIDDVTRGLWAADLDEPVDHKQLGAWSVEQRSAYLARKGSVETLAEQDSHTRTLTAEIQAIVVKWQQMRGDNRPLARSFAGERRDYDINLDGMAHYGMLPDFLQDLRNLGLSAEELAPLFRSAFDYVEMWDVCTQRAAQLSSESTPGT